MRIDLVDAGKRYNRDWIFRHLNFIFSDNSSYAITGPNGSGKSTMLQIIATASTISEGSVSYFHNDVNIDTEKTYKHFSIAAPYLDLIEEMTLLEMMAFHFKMKPLISQINISDIISIIGLKDATNKQIRYYSSGMKQRVKLALAIFSDVQVILLDEPCTNLDTAGILLYHDLIKTFTAQKLIIISSNDVNEYGFVNTVINMNALSQYQN